MTPQPVRRHSEIASRGTTDSFRVAIGPVPATGGVRTHILDLARFSRHEPALFSEPRFSPYNPMYGGWRTWLLTHPWFPPVDPYVRFCLAPSIGTVRILHTHGHPVWIDLYRQAPRWNVVRVHTVHQIYDRGDSQLPREWRRLSLLNQRLIEYCRGADASIAVSTHIRQALERAGCVNVHEIPSGIDSKQLDAARPPRARQRFGLPQEFVVTISHTGAVKNPSLVVEVAHEIAPMPLVAVGPGMTTRGLRNIGLEAPTNMLCLGPMPHGDVLDILAAASVFFLPSAREGLSLAALEALGLGLPCALPDLPSLRQATEDGDVACLYTPGRLDKAVAAIRHACGDRGLGQRAKDSCRRRYDWRQVANRIDSLYESLVGG